MKAILGLLFMLLPVFAHAADPTPTSTMMLGGFAPPSGDPALGVIGQLVGDLGGMGFFPGSAPEITGMFTVFNTAVIAVAAIYFMWNTLSATLQGAHDGEFLGKRYHSYWMPLRTFTGIFFLMPLFGGWSAAQVFMGWAAWGGTGIANAVHAGAKTVIAAETMQKVATPKLPDMAIAVQNLAALHDEVIVRKQEQRNLSSSGLTSADTPLLTANFTTSIAVDPAKKWIEVVAGANPAFENTGPDGIGRYRYSIEGAEATYVQSVAVQNAYRDAVIEVVRDANTALAAHSNQMGGLEPTSREWLDENGRYKATQIRLAAEMPVQILARVEAARIAAGGMATSTVTGSSIETQFGWMGAGLGIVDGTISSYEAASLTGSGKAQKGSSTAPDSANKTRAALQAANDSIVLRDITAYLRTAENSKQDAKAASAAGNYAESSFQWAKYAAMKVVGESNSFLYHHTPFGEASDAVATVVDPENFSIEAWLDKFNAKMREAVLSLQSSVMTMMEQKTNPIAAMQNLGISLVGEVGKIVMGIGAIMLTAAVVVFFLPQGGAGALGSIVSFFGTMAVMMLAPIFFFGLKLAAVLPFIPVIIWIGAVINYLVIFIESLFGAQLWALVHLDPDGEGMGQQSKHGYVFLLNLFFRPAMMVVCLSFAYKLMSIAGGLAISGISGVLQAVSSNESSGWVTPLVMTIGAIWVWVALMESLIHTCMSIVTVVPTQVITWIGGTFGSNVGTDLDRGTTQSAQGMAGSVGSVAGQAGQKTSSDFASGAMGANRARQGWRTQTVPGVEGKYSRSEIKGADDQIRSEKLQGAFRQSNGSSSGRDLPPSGGGGSPFDGPNAISSGRGMPPSTPRGGGSPSGSPAPSSGNPQSTPPSTSGGGGSVSGSGSSTPSSGRPRRF